METDIHSSCKELEKMLMDDFENLVTRLLSGDRKSTITGSPCMSRCFEDIVSRVCFLSFQLSTYEQSSEYRDNKIVSQPVDECFFQGRTINALKNDGIHYIHELITNTERELSRIPNIGKTTLKDINEVLAEMGLCLCKK